MNKGKYSRLNKLCIITIIISIIIGFFNPYEQCLTIFYNFWYPFAMFIYFINVKAARKASESTVVRSVVSYTDDYQELLEGNGMKIFMIGAMCFIKIIFFVTQLIANLSRENFGINLIQNTFLINNALLLFILATIAEIAVVIIFSIRIWNENGQAVVKNEKY